MTDKLEETLLHIKSDLVRVVAMHAIDES